MFESNKIIVGALLLLERGFYGTALNHHFSRFTSVRCSYLPNIVVISLVREIEKRHLWK